MTYAEGRDMTPLKEADAFVKLLEGGDDEESLALRSPRGADA